MVTREDELSLARLLALVVFFFEFVNEVLDEVEHAIAGPHFVPEVRRGVAAMLHASLGGTGGFPAPPILAPVERQKSRLRSCKLGSDVDQVGINGEVRQAAPGTQERLLGSRSSRYCAIGVLTFCPVERVLELAVKNGMPFRKRPGRCSSRSVRCSGAGEPRRRDWLLEAPKLFVEPGDRTKVCQPELHPESLMPFAAIERAAPFDLPRKAGEELSLTSAPWCCWSFPHSLAWVA